MVASRKKGTIMFGMGSVELTEKQKKFFVHLEKGSTVYSEHLCEPGRCELLESIKQGRGFKKSILCKVFGEEMTPPMFTECGSIYTSDIMASDIWNS